jgi:hypothetical protein
MAPIVRNVCAEYGIKYIIRDNLWTAIGGHIGLLHFLASGEAAFGHMIDDHSTPAIEGSYLREGSYSETESESDAGQEDICRTDRKSTGQVDMMTGKVDSITAGWGLYGLVAMVGLWRWKAQEKLD